MSAGAIGSGLDRFVTALDRARAVAPVQSGGDAAVLCKSTEDFDREEKMPGYAREGVRHAWWIDPVARTLEVDELGAGGVRGEPSVHREVERVRAAPFEAIELDLSVLRA